jgi:uncharacterized protein (DUF1501 family)
MPSGRSLTALTRRRLIAGSCRLGAALPFVTALPFGAALAAAGPRILVLVELNGGNDGLNSVVPYADPAYYAARPTLAVPRDQVLQLDERLGLHPDLVALLPSWQAGELAIALGVGYQPANRSHFRSIEIWNTASEAGENLAEGWLQRVVAETVARGVPPGAGFAARGIVLGGPEGPLAGNAFPTVVMRDPRQLREAADLLAGDGEGARNPALSHILATRSRLHGAAEEIARQLKTSPAPTNEFPRSAVGRQLHQTAALIGAGVSASVIKVQHSGYDTHAQQHGRHATLLRELAEGLMAFRAAMVEAGAWHRCLVMTYAEFGRRVAENASGGSDHGTAAPHLLLGGGIKGGFLGEQPALDDLEAGDLRPRLDFRRLYAAVAQDWLGLPPATASLGNHRPLPLLA